jgi:hypothetical protein
MSPEDKLIAAADSLKADIEKAKSIWSSYEVYIVAAACLIVGMIIGHKL